MMFTAGCHRHAAGPASASAPSAEAAGQSLAVIDRGRYLAIAGDCISCHTRPGGQPFAGGVPFETPLGRLYSTNITPDMESGIGRWREEDLGRALHEGVSADGRRLFPAFPYTSFAKVTDIDVKAIYAYLRTLEPVRYTPPSNGVVFSQRWGLFFWDKIFLQPGEYIPDASQSTEWNRGAYLVEGLGHCGACHTSRNLLMAEVASHAYAGGSFQEKVSGNRIRRWSAVNLTPSRAGLGTWSVEDITSYLRSGYTQRGGAFGPMNDVIVNSTRHMTADDLHAIAVYLRSLPPREAAVDEKPDPKEMTEGATIYADRCEKCHASSGRGNHFGGPRLAGSAVTQAQDPASLINVILYGPDAPTTALGSFGGWEIMKPYRDILTEAEVAAVSNYVRNSWGNRGSVVTVRDVAEQR
jgi:mono/diheme cytochrome c family protein